MKKIVDKDTGKERDCCDPRTDFVIKKDKVAAEIKKKQRIKKLWECAHCGQIWRYGYDGMKQVWKEVYEKK